MGLMFHRWRSGKGELVSNRFGRSEPSDSQNYDQNVLYCDNIHVLIYSINKCDSWKADSALLSAWRIK